MDRINKIVKSFTNEDFESLLGTVSANNADKSSTLLTLARESNYADKQCIELLAIKPNAFYTLKSRLNQKIESFLLSRMEAPKMDLIKKVSYASDVMLNTDREISSVMLKKLEKELLDYDLPYELIKVYQSLKKLYIDQPETYYNYSQLYNKHVAYTLAIDKAEDMIGSYFKIFAEYELSKDSTLVMQLRIIRKEILTICNLYQSHRLFTYKSMVDVYHVLYVPFDAEDDIELGDVEDIFSNIDDILEKYSNDSFYLLLNPIFDFLKFEYYHRLGLPKKEMPFYESLNSQLESFLKYFNFYTYTPRFLFSKIERANNTDGINEMILENESFFNEFEPNKNNVPLFISFHMYKAVSEYYQGQYEDAARTLNNLRNEISFKKYVHAELETKLMLALMYCLLKEEDMATQLIKSMQRQVRNSEHHLYESAALFMKMLNKLINQQPDKAGPIYNRFAQINKGEDSVLSFLKINTAAFK